MLLSCRCIICQYSFVHNDRALTLPCAHVFHEGNVKHIAHNLKNLNMLTVFSCVCFVHDVPIECVDGWIRENNSCPLCKLEIAPM